MIKGQKAFWAIAALWGCILTGCTVQDSKMTEVEAQANILEEPMKHRDQILFRMAVREKAGHPFAEAGRYFAELVEEKTEGRIRIIIEEASETDDEKVVVQEVEHGSLDLAQVSLDSLTEYNQQLTVLEFPFLFEDSEHMWAVLDSEIGISFLKSMENKGIEGLCWYDAGTRNLYTTDKSVLNQEELEQLRIQVNGSPFMMDVISVMGALPMDISDRDMRQALKKGQADGIENDITGYAESGLWEQASHGLLTEHARIPEVLIMNYRTFGQLEEGDRRMIEDAAKEASEYQRELWRKYEIEQKERLEQAGVVWEVPKNRTAFREKVWPVYEIYGESYLEIVEKIEKMKSSLKK